MRFKKFLLIPLIIPILIFAYLMFVDSLVSGKISVLDISKQQKVAGAEAFGVSMAVSVQVKRPYLFGLLELPIYAPGIGSIAAFHTAFFWFIGILTLALIAIFVIIERRSSGMVKIQAIKRPNIWIRLGKAIGIGALFALIAFVISGDASSLALGLLVAYLEFRLF